MGNVVTAEQLQEFKDNYERMKKHYLVLKGLNKVCWDRFRTVSLHDFAF